MIIRLKSKYTTTRAQNSICDNQEKSLESQCPTTENSLVPSLRVHSADLMSNIESLISSQLVSFFIWRISFIYNTFFSLSKEISGTEIPWPNFWLTKWKRLQRFSNKITRAKNTKTTGSFVWFSELHYCRSYFRKLCSVAIEFGLKKNNISALYIILEKFASY